MQIICKNDGVNIIKLKYKLINMLLILALLFTLTSCKTKVQNNENFKIATSFYPVYIATKNIAKDIDGVEVVDMTKPTTGCLHDYNVTPMDMKNLEGADVLVINGADMESFMDKVMAQFPKLKIVDSSTNIELINGGGDEGYNPHIWVSISNYITQIQNITTELATIDPVHAVSYKANSKAYIAKLEELKVEMHEALDDVQNKNIVTFHEAFPYFAKEFNLNIVAVIEREPGSEPSPRQLGDTIDEILKLGIKVLFAEPQYSQKAADAIAIETGSKVYYLDPGVTGDDSEDAYLNIMKENLKVLKEALK